LSKYKNFILFAVLVSLIAISLWLFTKDETAIKKDYRDVDFSISIAANVDSIILTRKGKEDLLTVKNEELFFNDVRIKPRLQEALHIILKQLEVKRPVSKKLQDQLSATIDSAGVQVKIYEKGEPIKELFLWGDKEKKVTYARLPASEEIYIVNIPGHSTYIADIFYYGEDEWRNNALFESTWRSLKELQVQYPKAESDNFTVEYAGEFFNIPELEAFDTIALLNYLEEFSSVRISRYLPENSILLDSLLDETPDMIVKIEDLEKSKSNRLLFYADSSKAFVIGKEQNIGVIPEKKYSEIKKNSGSFLLKKNIK
jgi:hypothetical protein